MPRNVELANVAILCNGKEARIQINSAWSKSSEKRIPSSANGTDTQADVEGNSIKDVSSRCLQRISNTGHAYSRTDVTSLGFTNEECEILATRQRSTNYLFYMYTERGQPVLREEKKKSPSSSFWNPERSLRIKRACEQGRNKLTIPVRRNEDSSWLNKRSCCSALPRRKPEKTERSRQARRATLSTLQTKASIDDSLGTIIIRSLNQDLSPAARLERYLINLQREGYLTSVRKERRKNIDVELDREVTPKGIVSLRSKFLPHPPVYLFERAVKNSPFNKCV